MASSYRIPAYAIVSADHMIADSTGTMPQALMFEADKEHFEHGLNLADIVVHGRHSSEWQPNSPKRRRIIMTRKVAAISPSPDNPRALLWNPAGASFEEACRAHGVAAGVVAVLGGPDVYRFFFDIGYDAFYLSRACRVTLPGGVPIFPEVRAGRTPEDVFTGFGYAAGPTTFLDEARAVTLVAWKPRKSG